VNVIASILNEIASVLIIIVFIQMMYKRRYGVIADRYMKNQFGIWTSSSMSCLVVLRAYYILENRYKIDMNYANGIMLTFAFLIGGLSTAYIYRHYFYCEESKYNPTQEEYLFIVSSSFVAISLKMVMANVISIVIPIALLTGRLIWLDTDSLKAIKQSITVGHKRLLETSVLFVLGILTVSFGLYIVHLPSSMQILIALGYGLIVYFVYGEIIKKRSL
jgi:hypothetical protein